ncbi:MAG: PhaM family polyhydroxyalkanoate granule multifunctional regulatory protein [Rhodoferax sp.]
MSDSASSGFGKFVPGFDFLQNLAKGASQSIPQMPNLANWVAPTLNAEELEKRIEELKAVHFWLEQNSRALGATIQALEVQKMTLATLKGMNFNLGDVANAFKLKAADSVAQGVQRVTDTAESAAKTLAGAATTVGSAARKATARPAAARKTAAAAADTTGKPGGGLPALVDPLQLWGSLTQQFQQIAASAMKDAGRNTAIDATRNLATGLAKEAVKAGRKVAASATAPAPKTRRRAPSARR